jgi:hypothetical protein|tara:strand:- start:402 stop:563 length:162 start_codon:yes stop_codon:yes gene_type:complete
LIAFIGPKLLFKYFHGCVFKPRKVYKECNGAKGKKERVRVKHKNILNVYAKKL